LQFSRGSLTIAKANRTKQKDGGKAVPLLLAPGQTSSGFEGR
jgi:hypothetical protein